MFGPDNRRAAEPARFALALIVVMLVRPEGLWPSKRRKAEFHDALDDGIPAADSQAADGLKG
jgi:branched-chain amino acid transport system permease protein